MVTMNRTTNVARDESEAIRRELHAHNEAQRAQYRRRAIVENARRAREQGRSHLSIARAA
ncbi:hypothetical protein KTD13_08430 [Burkholderia multivorans]|uniref:hypothetical protein n=1 Tax=Burkholderia multivorans TaxID=87883 RepID=UPI001C22E4AB|nr:hypothetical protein [Burkholderia multivorans]MBU9260371.1 hypothetical protein [Burkholderia multivorans]MBU9297941.1 hypothetical protein [Burkholderia multivorans]MBU9612877.1 hypothetical protein [Burkholderia multivorans]